MQIIILVDGIVQNFLQDIKHPGRFPDQPVCGGLVHFEAVFGKEFDDSSTDME